jgi:hypothetical protein
MKTGEIGRRKVWRLKIVIKNKLVNFGRERTNTRGNR